MTPLEKRDSRQNGSSRAARERSTKPSDAAVEAWLGAESNEPDGAFDGLLFAHRFGQLSEEHRQRVEERLRTDPKFRTRVDKLAMILNLRRGTDTAQAVADRAWKNLKTQLELERQGMRLPSRLTRRMYRHHIDRYSLPDEPLDPSEFVQRLAAALGSDSAMALVVQAFATVEATGKADGWIVEVGRAREQGVVSSELAHFLIWELAESAMTQLIIKNPWLSMLNAQLERIEREHGLEEGESWDLEEAPPEWRAPYLEWEDAYDKLFMLTLLRNGEHEVFHEEGQYYIGRAEIFGL